LLTYRSGLQIPEGTRVALVGEANAPLTEVQYVVRSAGTSTEATGQETLASNMSIQSVQPTGNEFRIELGPLNNSQVVEVRLLDEYGLCAEQIPRYILTVQTDSIPEVDTQLLGIGSAITPQAVLPISGRITDDHAIAAVKLELARSDDRLLKIDLQLSGGETVEQQVDLNTLAEQQGFLLEPGEAVGLVVTAQDYFDLNGQQHIGRGQPQLLSVVTEDQLLVLLDRQELELRQRLERIMTELEELREVLQQLATSQDLVSSGMVASVSQEDDDQQQRMLVFWAQQSVLQGDKSEQELVGVADRVENIRQQLENNRIDSYDRQARLREKVFSPLTSLLEAEYSVLSQKLLETQSSTMSGNGSQAAKSAIIALDAVLVKLESIRDNMLDIESFNEIIDLVRGLLEDQNELLEETETAQKQSILDLLK
jgi:hypothetical protein